ncbi:unnamed protein product [Aphanomyces euteiches]|nr:hypothetical protein AeRB84_013727 [Aphanomyces euteiches]
MSTQDTTRASWSNERDEFLVTALQAQVVKGKRSDSGYKKEAWVEVTAAFNDRFGTTYHVSKIKSRLDCLKRDYKDVKYLRKNSGFGYNGELGLPTAPDDVWTSICKSNPKCKKFRSVPFPLFERLAILLDGAYADGRYSAVPPGVVVLHDKVGEIETELQPPRHTRATTTILDDDEDSVSSLDDLTPPPKKLQKKQYTREKRTAGAVIGDAISKLVEVEAAKTQHQQDPHERVSQAIALLMDNFNHLDGSKIARLAAKMGDGFNATIFMALRGAAREAWVDNNSD